MIPLALILPEYFDVDRTCYAEPIADIGMAITTGVVFLLMSKKLLNKQE